MSRKIIFAAVISAAFLTVGCASNNDPKTASSQSGQTQAQTTTANSTGSDARKTAQELIEQRGVVKAIVQKDNSAEIPAAVSSGLARILGMAISSLTGLPTDFGISGAVRQAAAKSNRDAKTFQYELEMEDGSIAFVEQPRRFGYVPVGQKVIIKRIEGNPVVALDAKMLSTTAMLPGETPEEASARTRREVFEVLKRAQEKSKASTEPDPKANRKYDSSYAASF